MRTWLFCIIISIHLLLVSADPLLSATEPADDISVKPLIVGGTEAQPGAWPWMVALAWTTSPSVFDEQFCGGTLINSRWVLTSASCVEGETTASFQVVAGIYDLVNDTGQKISVKRIIQHPDYIPATNDNDLALIELNSAASQQAIPVYSGIPFGAVSPSLAGVSATVIGWGNTSSTGYIWPQVLQQVAVPVLSNTVCNSTAPYVGEITANMLCAGYAAGGKDACTGDSGGPLMVLIDGQWVLAGVTSWGYGCADPYGVYARVSTALSFIKLYVPEASFLPIAKKPKGLPWVLLLMR